MSHTPTSPSNPEPSDPAARWIELAEQILVCGRAFRDDLTQQAGRWRLSEPEFSMLWACRQAPPTGFGQNELAAALAISAAQVSGLVEQLRRNGLLEGHRAEPDRRRQYWRLTPDGQAKLQAVLADLADWAGWLDDRLGGIDSNNLVRLLDQLAEMLRTRARSHVAARPRRNPFGPQTVRRDADRKGAA